MLKNETIIESPEDVDGVLELCHVLIKDQTDSSGRGSSGGVGVGGAAANGQSSNINASVRRQGSHFLEREEMAEEQGWVARMVHLFRAESLDVQFEVIGSRLCNADLFILTLNPKLLQIARRHFDLGGERMRFTFPALITSSIRLCRRYKNREHLVGVFYLLDF